LPVSARAVGDTHQADRVKTCRNGFRRSARCVRIRVISHIFGHDRSQTLLPEFLDDYVGPENPLRFIEAFVDGLDLTAAGFARVTPEVTGRPGYAPKDLLKLYIYGYLNRLRNRLLSGSRVVIRMVPLAGIWCDG